MRPVHAPFPPPAPASSAAGRTALVLGIRGQDGCYLAAHLVGLGYRVVGTSRDPRPIPGEGLDRLGIRDRVTLLPLSPVDFAAVKRLLDEVRPEEIYNLAGQSSVGLSFERPLETLESIVVGTGNLLEALRTLRLPARLFQAGSGAMCGVVDAGPITEKTVPQPRSPYGIAKAAACWQVAEYRETHGVAAVTGILFNHDSPLRPEQFVTQKIVAAACRIAAGSPETLPLGNLAVVRDWGWAPEFVVAMHAMLQMDPLEDLVIATGRDATLEEFVATAFAVVGLDWRRHVVHDPALLRAGDVTRLVADPTRAWERLGWRARVAMPDVVRLMVEARLAAGTRRAA